jgi:hypothetical protein
MERITQSEMFNAGSDAIHAAIVEALHTVEEWVTAQQKTALDVLGHRRTPTLEDTAEGQVRDFNFMAISQAFKALDMLKEGWAEWRLLDDLLDNPDGPDDYAT